MIAEIRPSTARGTLTAPPSKSMAHRLLVCAALSEGESVIRHLGYSQDILATIGCLRALGAQIRTDGDTAYITGADPRRVTDHRTVLNCNECGSTLRFLIPLCMLSGQERVLSGSAYLMSRPLQVYEDIAKDQGMRFVKQEDSLTVQGTLHSGVYTVRGDISSQFISGLLFALPLLNGDSEVRLLPPVESRPYIAMTVAALRQFGIEIAEDQDTYRVPGDQRYTPCSTRVEGDYSNAAFFAAMNELGAQVRIEGLDDASLQGDSVYKILYKKIKKDNEPIDIADCPDLGPVLFALAAASGGAVFTGTRRLRMKESDRAAAMAQELSKFGVQVDVEENRVTVQNCRLCRPCVPLSGHGDHRIVMALAVLAVLTGGVIDGAEAVAKSYPDFFEKMKDLGVEVTVWNGSVNQKS